MDVTFRLTNAANVRATIAHLFLGVQPENSSVGAITLFPHQIDACARIELAFDQFGGAILCDDVGMGKTFVATSIASGFAKVLVVCPAALRQMWQQALAQSELTVDQTSFEALSWRRVHDNNYDLIVVDEAHHVRNPSTQRYRQLATLSRSAKVLLLSATPIHNRRRDLTVLLALFLGEKAGALSEADYSRCIIRREHAELGDPSLLPAIAVKPDVEIGDDPDIVTAIRALPPPIPVRDGGVARELLIRGLIHQWASSEAACRAAIERRRARGEILLSTLRCGRLPDEKELASWAFDDKSVQLGFPELFVESVANAGDLTNTLTEHLDALVMLLRLQRRESSLDEQRSAAIKNICAEHAGSMIVAFAQYDETVRTLFRSLSSTTRVALLTARGARIASGQVTREFVLDQFAPGRTPVPEHQRIDLLLATDILSEGVNLQRANTIIHLDTPWTAARMDQRIGRVARIGSSHPTVHVYRICAPASARRFLQMESVVLRKWKTARAAVGVAGVSPFSESHPRCERATNTGDHESLSPVVQNEKLRSTLRSWLDAGGNLSFGEDTIILASVAADTTGFLAAVTIEHESVLLTSRDGRIETDLGSLCQGVERATGGDASVSVADAHAALEQIQDWYHAASARNLVGFGESALSTRRNLLKRIDAIVAQSALHTRSALAAQASRARDVVNSRHSAAIDSDLARLLQTDYDNADFLEAVSRTTASFNAPPNGTNGRFQAPLRIRALLLFTPPRAS